MSPSPLFTICVLLQLLFLPWLVSHPVLNINELYYHNNCEALRNNNFNSCTKSSDLHIAYTSSYTFITPSTRKNIDLNFTNKSLGSNIIVAVRQLDSEELIWSASGIENINEITTFVNLETDMKYLIEVQSDIYSTGEYEIGISFNASTPPSNDLCVNAELLFDDGIPECGEGNINIYPMTSCATPDAEATDNCVSPTDPGVWYTFTTPSSLPYNSLFQANGPSDFELFSSTSGCTGLVYEDCSANFLTFSPQPNTTYYMLCATEEPHSISWDVPGINFPHDCGSPFPALNMGPGISQSSSITSCADPSSVVQCQEDHVIWYNYTTGCSIGDLTIEVEPWDAPFSLLGAEEVAISVFLDDCTTLASMYDPNGIGYVCSGIGAEEVMTLEDIPPETDLLFAFSSNDNETGSFIITVDEMNAGMPDNDICPEYSEVMVGTNSELSNNCATPDVNIPSCASQSDATVWYELDIGSAAQDVSIEIISDGIADPAIAAYEDCGAVVLGSNCSPYLELQCISGIIKIQIGTATGNEGNFDLEITLDNPESAPEPEWTASNICNDDPADVFVYFPNGESADFTVEVSPNSSSSIGGMSSDFISNVTSFEINDFLSNSASTPQNAVYLITSEAEGNCNSFIFEVSFMVYPAFFEIIPDIEECLPLDITLLAGDIIQGGVLPYSVYTWTWEDGDIYGNTEMLTYEFIEPGTLTLEVIDDVGCAYETNIDIEGLDVEEPEFDFPLDYCTAVDDIVTFPITSENDIDGVWDPPFIDVGLYPDEDIDITFFPDPEFCSEEVTLTLFVNPEENPEFSIPLELCANLGIYIFPTEDESGISGTWTFPEIDFSNQSGTITNIFSPSSSDCISTYEHTLDILQPTLVTFDIPDELCKDDLPYFFDTESLEGYSGSWSIPQFIPDQIAGNILSNTWTASDPNNTCANTVDISILLVDPTIPTFSLPASLCDDSGIFIFPTVTSDGMITGTWSIEQIDPTNSTNQITSIFTPDFSFCAEQFSWTIDIQQTQTAIFSFEENLCALDPILILPTVSDNGINGQWSISSIDPMATQGQQISVSFAPDGGHQCSEEYMTVINVSALSTPLFELDYYKCWDDQPLSLSNISDNGIIGTWQFPTIDIQSNLGQTITNIFTSNPDQCAENFTYELMIIPAYDLQPVAISPMDCATTDGQIEIQGSTAGLEYSIDGGVSWTSQANFDGLGSGIYSLISRAIDFPSCELELTTALSVSEAPTIEGIDATDLTSCLAIDGTITIEAIGNNLEYSLDGINWQSENRFSNLPEAFYSIYIRESSTIACVVEGSASVAGFPNTSILNIEIDEVSDCDIENGQITIDAIGQNIEYSIDGGITWQDSNVFSDLPSDDYQIAVQSKDAPECNDDRIASVSSPGAPVITDIQQIDPSDCQPNAGSIIISAIGNNLEYSIDGGLSWNNENSFDQLYAGIYNIVIREIANTSCIIREIVELVKVTESLEKPEFNVINVSECMALDGAIIIEASSLPTEQSIDGGNTWQNDLTFSNLSSGLYNIALRLESAPECMVLIQAIIPNEDCPCSDLDVTFDIYIPVCSNDGDATISVASVMGMTDPNITYSWSNNTNGQGITNLETGTYDLFIEYDDNCIWEETLNIELPTEIAFNYESIGTNCPEAPNGIISILNTSGGAGNYSYSLEGTPFQSENVFNNLLPATYEVIVMDNDGCIASELIEVLSNSALLIDVPEIETIDLGESILLDPQLDTARIESLVWTANDVAIPDANLQLIATPTATTNYSIIVNYGGCFAIADILVQVILPSDIEESEEPEDDELYIGNIFQPGSTQNNTLFIQAKQDSKIQVSNFSIYDRWGNLIYNKEMPQLNLSTDGWDGQYNSVHVNPGVYVYKVVYELAGQEQIVAGTVTVIR